MGLGAQGGFREMPEYLNRGAFSHRASSPGVRDGQLHLSTSPWGLAFSLSLPQCLSFHW